MRFTNPPPMIWRKLAASLILIALIVGLAGVTQLRARQRATSAEAAFPATGQFITANGYKIHAVISGSGPDLILIHGASGSSRDFTFALTARLAPHYRVIAFDRPGMGWSTGDDLSLSPAAQADILRAAAAHLNVQNPIVLGHSYGGSVAMAWALQAPTQTAALVIVSGATMPWPGKLDLWYRLTSTRIGAAILIPLAAAFVSPSTADKAILSIFTPQTAPDGYAKFIGTPLSLRIASLRTNNAQVNQLKSHLRLQSQNYPTLTLPIELIHGDADTIVPLTVHALPLSEILPNAHLTILPGVGHMPHHSHAADVIAAINRAASRARLR